jgi:hypothetical protein
MDNIPNPVYYKDTKGLYLGYSKAFLAYFRLKDDNYVGKTVLIFPSVVRKRCCIIKPIWSSSNYQVVRRANELNAKLQTIMKTRQWVIDYSLQIK